MTFNQYIDLSWMSEDADLLCFLDAEMYPKRSKGLHYHVGAPDDYTSNALEGLLETYPKLLVQAAGQKWARLKNTFVDPDKGPEFPSLEPKFYRSEGKKWYLMHLYAENSGWARVVGLIHKPSGEYVFLGYSGGCPFLSTKELFLTASAGGPDLEVKTQTPKALLAAMPSFWAEFTAG